MDYHKILPFYMTYPLPLFYEDEDQVLRDLEYLQQLYPVKAKNYQAKIAQLLDVIDYEGSLLYDEYPDQLQLYKLSKDIYDRIINEEMNGEGENNSNMQSNPENSLQNSEKFILIQILLYYEVYKRRHENRRKGYLKF